MKAEAELLEVVMVAIISEPFDAFVWRVLQSDVQGGLLADIMAVSNNPIKALVVRTAAHMLDLVKILHFECCSAISPPMQLARLTPFMSCCGARCWHCSALCTTDANLITIAFLFCSCGW